MANTKAQKLPAEAATAKRLIDSITVPGTWLDAALAEYATKHKNGAERVGLCHNIAVAILRDLHSQGNATDWVWCRGYLPGGVEHSWAEYRGVLRVDMGDQHKLRFTPVAGGNAFAVASDITVRSPEETVRWAEEWENSGETGANAASPGTVRARLASTSPSEQNVTDTKRAKVKRLAREARKRQRAEKAKQRRKR